MHTLIVGRTLSGKTTWATKKAHALQKKGINCLVLDRFRDPRWIADKTKCFVFTDKEEFLSVVWDKNTRQCAVFVDEAGVEVGKYSDVMNELATTGRHWGHKCFFITQRPKQLSTTLRSQCSELVIFKQSLNDTKDLSDEFVEPLINKAHTLNKGEFILVRDCEKPLILNVFDL